MRKIPKLSDLDRAILLYLLLLCLMAVHPMPKIDEMAWAMFGVILGFLSHSEKTRQE